MNSFQYENQGISQAELVVMQGREAVENVLSISEWEKYAIQYARLIQALGVSSAGFSDHCEH
jgi:hypothetical protein